MWEQLGQLARFGQGENKMTWSFLLLSPSKSAYFVDKAGQQLRKERAQLCVFEKRAGENIGGFIGLAPKYDDVTIETMSYTRLDPTVPYYPLNCAIEAMRSEGWQVSLGKWQLESTVATIVLFGMQSARQRRRCLHSAEETPSRTADLSDAGVFEFVVQRFFDHFDRAISVKFHNSKRKPSIHVCCLPELYD